MICGVDEAGRGPLAGPVFAAAVILDENNPISGLADSKKLSKKKRELLYDEIIKKAKSYAICSVSESDIDRLNILQATLKAMAEAINTLDILPTLVLVDGNKKPKTNFETEAIVKGDSLVPQISAASILAKVSRDRYMLEMDRLYPNYGFAKHQGYGTKMHLDAIKEYGITPIHRKTFAPISQYVDLFVKE